MSCMVAWRPKYDSKYDSKYGTTRVLFASTYTAKQMKTMYYSLILYISNTCFTGGVLLLNVGYKGCKVCLLSNFPLSTVYFHFSTFQR